MAAEEAVTNEVVASAHVENYAVKLFLWADKEDRASHFNKNVVKAFYSAGILFDVLTICTQSELSPENAHMRKYSKWKAAYIHNCLKNGETPVPGPMEGEDDFPGEPPQEDAGPSVWQQPQNASEVVQVILNHVTTVGVKSFYSSGALPLPYYSYINFTTIHCSLHQPLEVSRFPSQLQQWLYLKFQQYPRYHKPQERQFP